MLYFDDIVQPFFTRRCGLVAGYGQRKTESSPPNQSRQKCSSPGPLRQLASWSVALTYPTMILYFCFGIDRHRYWACTVLGKALISCRLLLHARNRLNLWRYAESPKTNTISVQFQRITYTSPFVNACAVWMWGTMAWLSISFRSLFFREPFSAISSSRHQKMLAKIGVKRKSSAGRV